MSDRSSIEWTDATWNPIGGCTRVSEGCRNCYAEIMAARFSGPGQWGEGLARMVKQPDGRTDHRWTGAVRLNEAALDKPLRWRSPRRIFVNSTSDPFHESVPDEWIDRLFAIMALAPQHTFQVLTKRPERMQEYFLESKGWRRRIAEKLNSLKPSPRWNGNVYQGWQNLHGRPDGLPNVWLGTSVEDQATADARIPHLLATPAAVRFVSAEPLLGPVDLTLDGLSCGPCLHCSDGPTDPETGLVDCRRCDGTGKGNEVLLDLVIVGGESGPGARPMHPDWARSLRDQCVAAGVPFFFKQWGEWGAGSVLMTTGEPVFRAFKDYRHWVHNAPTWVNGGMCMDAVGRHCKIGADFMRARDEGTFPVTIIHRVGKRAAGRLLDGRTWDQMPGDAG